MSAAAPAARRARNPWQRPARVALHAFLVVTALVWLFPLLWAVFTSLRPIGDTITHGYVSWPTTLNFGNYTTVWEQADMLHYFFNTLVIVIPGVLLTLLLASMVAFCLTQFNWRFNVIVLMIFTAGNLLPPQVIIVPLFWIYLNVPLPDFISDTSALYDQYIGVILIHVVFQTGFATFVLSNYMKTITKEVTESALVDGANIFRIWWSVILPLCRPALGAIGTLLFTFMYNDFFWALVLMKTGNRRPITAALNNLHGAFFTNQNLLAAGSLMAAIPPIVVFILLQKQFVRGLTLGATKG